MKKRYVYLLAIVIAVGSFLSLFSPVSAKLKISELVNSSSSENFLNQSVSSPGQAYVTLSFSNLVSVIDTTTHAEVGTISVGAAGCNFPWRATMSPDGAWVYVGCNGSDSVAVIDTANNTVTSNITGIPNADDVAFTHDGAYALVGSRSSWQVAVVDTSTLMVTNFIPTTSYARSIVIHPFIDLAYVTSGDGTIKVVDTTTFSIIDTISIGGEPWDIDVSPDGQWVFATDRWGAGLHVIDTNTNTLFTTITGLGELTGVTVAPDGSEIYANSLGIGVRVIDAQTFSLITTVQVFNSPWELAATCDGSEVYVGNNSSQVPVIDTGTYSVTTQISVSGSGTKGIAICPQYVASGVFLNPDSQLNQGAPGEVVAHETSLTNATGATDSFTLTLGSHAWDTSLSDAVLGPLVHGESITFTVYVTVPMGTDWYLTDTVSVQATSVTSPTVYTATAEMTTQAYAPPQISVNPDSLSSTQFVGEVVTQNLTIQNGLGVTLTFEIAEIGEGTAPVQAVINSVPAVTNQGNTSDPPEDKYFLNTHDTGAFQAYFSESRMLEGSSVLIIQDEYPWGYDSIQQILNNYGIGYDQVGSSLIPTIDLSPYELVIIPSVQDGNFYSIWDANLSKFEVYVESGGALWLSGTTQGSTPLLPGGVTNTFSPDDYNDIIEIDHPWVLGVPNPIYGNSASHNWFTNLYPGSLIVAEAQFSGNATLVDYNLGAGRILLTGQTLEFAWVNNWDGGPILENSLLNMYLWMPGSDVKWLSETPISGTVNTNSSQLISIVFNATDLQPGNYAAQLQVESNDPISSTIPVPVTMTVQPTANMGWVEGYVTDGSTGDPLEATIIAFGQPYTITTDPGTGYYKFWLDAGSYTLQVSSSGYVTETANINITAQQGIIQDFALVLNVPVIEVSPVSLSVVHDVGDITTQVFTITNNGPAPLVFEIEKLNGEFVPLPMAVDSPNTGGGPDAFGYIFRDSNEPDGPTYEWEDILSSGMVITGWNSIDDGYAGPIPIGFDFNFYGNVYSEFYVGTNGYLSFGQGYGTIPGGTLPNSSNPNNDIAIFGSDLYLYNYGSESVVYYQTFNNPSRLVIEFVNIHYCCGFNTPHTFEIVLYPDGDILVQYESLFGTSTSYAGIENETGSIGLTYGATLSDTLAICYTFPGNFPGCRGEDVPWLTTLPVSGTVSGYSDIPIQVIFDATGLQPGTYTADLIVQSNDPQTPNATVSVAMTVQPTTNMGSVTGSVTDAWTGEPITVTVQLMGIYTTTADPDYVVWAEAGDYTLMAYAPGYYTGTWPVTIEAGSQTIQNLALEPAQARLEVEPDILNASVAEGFSADYTMVISNTGPVPLDFSLHEIDPAAELFTLVPAGLDGKQILYDQSHGEPSYLDYSSLIIDLQNAGATVTVNYSTTIDLAYLEGYDVLWVNCCGYNDWTFNELTAVADWLDQGGAVFIQGDVSPATSGVAEIFGITYQNGSCNSGTTTNILSHPVSAGVEAVYVDFTCRYLDFGTNADIVVYDIYNQVHSVAQQEGGGKMVVVASENFTNWRIDNDDNRLFATNILSWLADPGYSDVPWLSVDPVTGTIPGHSAMEVTVNFDATNLSLGSFDAILALEHNDPAQFSPVEIPVTLSVVEPQAAVSMTSSGLQASGLPGETVVYTLTMTNDGNIPDTFTLQADSIWQADLSTATTPQLNPGESYVFTLSVTVPSDAGDGDNDVATVSAESAFDTNVSASVQVITTAYLEIRRVLLPIVVR